MLRKVVFALKDGTGNRLQLSLRSLIQELKQHGIEVAYAICLEDKVCGEQSAAAVCGEDCLLKKHGSICAFNYLCGGSGRAGYPLYHGFFRAVLYLAAAREICPALQTPVESGGCV